MSSTQRSENWARLVQTFWPLITHLEAVPASPPSGTARQRSDARSLPESGSENPWHQSSAPESRRGTTSAASSGGAKSMSVGASTSISEKRPGSTRSRAARAAPSSVRSIGEPPRPPTRSGHPRCIQPASNRIDFTRCIWATRSSMRSGRGIPGRQLLVVRVEPRVELGAVVGEVGHPDANHCFRRRRMAFSHPTAGGAEVARPCSPKGWSRPSPRHAIVL